MTRTQHLITPIEPAAGSHFGDYYRRQACPRQTVSRRRDIASRGREWGRHDSGLPDERPIYM